MSQLPWSRSRSSHASTAPGHRRGEGAGSGHQLETLGEVVLARGARRRRALTGEHGRRGVVTGLEDGDQIAAGAVEVRFDHVQHERARDCSVEGVAAALENRLSTRRGEPVGRGGHPEGALEGRAGGERRRRRESHAARLSTAAGLPRPPGPFPVS